MKIALFLLSFWASFAAAQTTVIIVGAPNSDYRRISAALDRNGDYWDFTALRTEAGYQGIAGARYTIHLPNNIQLSPGIYTIFGHSKELFGSGLGLGWSGERGRVGTEGWVMQYINPTKYSLSRYTIGEGELAFRLVRGLHATGGGKIVHNSPQASRSIAWGGGVAYRLKKSTGKWTLFTHTRGVEVQLGLVWSPPGKHKKKKQRH